MIVIIKTKQQIKDGPPDPPTHNADGSLTRAGAAQEARKLWGEMGCVSFDEVLPRLVWCIGRFDLTVGKGRTWEDALKRSTAKKERLKLKEENYVEEGGKKDAHVRESGTRSITQGPAEREDHRGSRAYGRRPVSRPAR